MARIIKHDKTANTQNIVASTNAVDILLNASKNVLGLDNVDEALTELKTDTNDIRNNMGINLSSIPIATRIDNIERDYSTLDNVTTKVGELNTTLTSKIATDINASASTINNNITTNYYNKTYIDTTIQDVIDRIPTGGGGTGDYVLPPATATTLGGVRIGANIDNTSGLISVATATTSTLGVVKAGTNISISSGVISVPNSSGSTAGVVKAGSNVSIYNGLLDVYTATYVDKGVASFNIDDFTIAQGKVSIKTNQMEIVNNVSGIVNLGTNSYYKCNNIDDVEIRLPTVTGYKQIHLFFDTTADLTLILPNCKWQGTPSFKANKTYEIIFTYDSTQWLGGVVEYGV